MNGYQQPQYGRMIAGRERISMLIYTGLVASAEGRRCGWVFAVAAAACLATTVLVLTVRRVQVRVWRGDRVLVRYAVLFVLVSQAVFASVAMAVPHWAVVSCVAVGAAGGAVAAGLVWLTVFSRRRRGGPGLRTGEPVVRP